MSMFNVKHYAERTHVASERAGYFRNGVPKFLEAVVRVHAEISEAFEAWIKRFTPSAELGDEDQIIGTINLGTHEEDFVSEWRVGTKPEGVAAELADVVLAACCAMTLRPHLVEECASIDLRAEPRRKALRHHTVVERLGILHKHAAAHDLDYVIYDTFFLADDLGIDLHSAIERKATYNDNRPGTTARM
jgi:hypothetical protein